ncbi:hypothetical protein F4604DRAFT_1676949 [Suillus subluteus]|nr:hypothetical protein F4604DRAFT_1676949 [Suillus subluteus]
MVPHSTYQGQGQRQRRQIAADQPEVPLAVDVDVVVEQDVAGGERVGFWRRLRHFFSCWNRVSLERIHGAATPIDQTHKEHVCISLKIPYAIHLHISNGTLPSTAEPLFPPPSQQDRDAQLPKQTESHGHDIADVKVEEDEEQEEHIESMSVMMDISAELATLQAAERGW